MMKNKEIVICGILLIICALTPYLLLIAVAFPSQHSCLWVVTFLDVLGWCKYPFSLDTMVGWCYIISLAVAVFLFVLGILLCIKKNVPIFYKKLLGLFVVITLILFYILAVVMNIAMAAQQDMQPTFAFYFYIFTEFLSIGVLVFSFSAIQWKIKNYKEKES